MNRLPFVCLLAATAAFGLSQSRYPEEDRILSAISKLREESQLYLYVEGTETTGNSTSRFKTHLYWQTDYVGTQPTHKFQLLQIRDGVLLQRIVADGNTVWNYDHRTKEYAVLRYGGYRPERPANYSRDLISFVSKHATGQAAWSTRLLREIHGEATPNYRSWMPGVQPTELPDGITQDPVWADRSYTATPTSDVILYNGSPRRTIAFELTDDPPSDVYRLANIYLNEKTKVGTRDRLTEWTLTPYKGIVFEERNFQPYSLDETRGWRPISDATSKG